VPIRKGGGVFGQKWGKKVGSQKKKKGYERDDRQKRRAGPTYLEEAAFWGQSSKRKLVNLKGADEKSCLEEGPWTRELAGTRGTSALRGEGKKRNIGRVIANGGNSA